ncbi:TIGR04282 family arsenosugar biosynthesis glycosyltransferase [Tautonia marina]|uniref:TIGR04282 family arsenosugar biosynthesis glycosyltransferase n=1 Tax=Tautonia marina TaxID=2653855 RepID=UPI0013757B07|nr:TIGR04282 family arsenosugar biosynthesis glycosyltransferase [Tautonia marina]
MAWPMPDGAVLGIFGKKPEPGKVKTRLAAEFGNDFAAEAHEAMLLDTLDTWGSNRFLAPGGRRVFVFAPDDAGPWFDSIVPAGLAMQAQAHGDLGARLQSFFEGEFADGASRVVVIGSDSPTLDPSIVVSAFLCLDQKDVVIGPSTDGGYYLIGCRVPVPSVFEGVEWGSSRVFGQTLDRLRGSGRSLAVLPPWYDIDTPDDWRLLGAHVRAMRLSGMDPALPRIEALLPRVLPALEPR